MPDASSKLQSISTELLIAFIFSVITTAVAAIYLLFALVGLVMALVAGAGLIAAIGGPGGLQAVGDGVVFARLLAGLFVAALPVGGLLVSLLLTLRLNRMRTAALKKNVRDLKQLNSIGWAIAGIFAGLIPGVLMLVAYGEINELRGAYTTAMADFQTDSMERLLRLKQMLDSGMITREDFELQKQRILHGSADVAEPSEPEELRKLRGLLDCGALSPEEYEAHKRRFLEAL